ncbi:hypothetical protein BLNAU_19034 [Blattamonas nauphoetae]|uniref:Uncharacterized protein n=1 Tax=Blattamonas nauphoetae TaxID=2049346 RepID=A0ABQ9X333_9EUKA|nr:hypothetical protein BLNAU_19034 [Blattamonas nauphoetae]
MVSSDAPKYSPFLKWSRNDPVTVDSVAHAFSSLISMVRDGYTFDEALVRQISTFLRSISWNMPLLFTSYDLMMALGQGSTDPIRVFLDSLVLLLSMPFPSIVEDTIPIVQRCFRESQSTLKKLPSRWPKYDPPLTPYLRELPEIADKSLLRAVLVIIEFGLRLTSTRSCRKISTDSNTGHQSIRDMVLREVFIPIEPSLARISHQILRLPWKSVSIVIKPLIFCIFKASVLHQPTHNFLSSSNIPMAFHSILVQSENRNEHMSVLSSISNLIMKWKDNGAKSVRGGRLLLQTLEQEGFRDTLEQRQNLDESVGNATTLMFSSYNILHFLGINRSRHV